jgi:hypothetical protein
LNSAFEQLPTANTEAYNLYLKAVHLNFFTPQNTMTPEKNFSMQPYLDPAFAEVVTLNKHGTG